MKKSVSKRYSDSELAKFKDIILKKIESAQHDLDLLKDSYSNASSNGTDDTYSSFKSAGVNDDSKAATPPCR